MTKLTPSERAINWAKALAIIVPLFGAGVFAGNTKTVHKWLAPDDVLPVDTTENERNAAINAKFQELEDAIKVLEADSKLRDGNINVRLKSLIDANSTAISKWHE